MYKSLVIALFLSTNSVMTTKLNQRQALHQKYVARENSEASLLNAYKNYNLDKLDGKTQEPAKKQWGADKSALELADEMNDEDETKGGDDEEESQKQQQIKPKVEKAEVKKVSALE